jgi:RIO kinase 2
MIEIQDMPESDGEDDDEEEEEEKDEDEEPQDGAKAPEEFDEEAFQKQMTDRLESIRLNKALGNDDPDDEDAEIETESESESEESDSGSDSGDSVGPAMTEFSSFDQNRKNRRPAAAPKAKGMTRADELKLTVAQQVGRERDIKEKKFHSKKSVNKAGNAKGHKWKNSEAFQVGKNSGW